MRHVSRPAVLTPRGFSGVLWTPANLGVTPSFWYSDDSTLTVPTGNEVSDWGSLGTGSFNIAQSTSANRPARVASGLNGRRTVSFDGSNDHLASTTTGARDHFRNVGIGFIAVVYKKAATDAGTNRFIGLNYTGSGGSRMSLLASSAANPNRPSLVVRRLDADSASVLGASSGGSTAWQMVIATMDWSTGVGTLYINGAQDAQNLSLTSSGLTSNTQASLSFIVGSNSAGTESADVEIAEYMQSAYLPSIVEVEKLFGYFGYRHSLAGELVSGHPYAALPPFA